MNKLWYDGKLTDTFRPPIEELSDSDFATLLMETKRFSETRWSPKMRRCDVSDERGTASPFHLRTLWAGGRPEVAVVPSDGEGLGEAE